MANIEITRDYAEGTALLEADLDAIQLSLTIFLNSTGISADNIQINGITASDKFINSTVTTAVIADSAITTDKILDANITTAKILAANVTTAKIADANVTTVKILDNNVTTAKIADANITTAKLLDANVTAVKREALVATATDTNTGSPAAAYVVIGEFSRNITTSLRPQMITWDKNAGTLLGNISHNSSVACSPSYEVKMEASPNGVTSWTAFYECLIRKDGGISGSTVMTFPVGSIWGIHIPSAAGTWYYRLSGRGYDSFTPSTDVQAGMSNAAYLKPLL